MTDRSFVWASAAVLALATGLHLFFFLRGFYSIGWDESGRTLDAYHWAVHGTAKANAWLPFYRVCIGLGLRLVPDLVLTPRFITFLWGLASIPATAWLAHELFRSPLTTRLALVLGALFSQRIALSLAPLSDIMFIAAMLAAMSLFARWLRDGGRASLYSCGLMIALTTTLRYEGWLFAAAVFLVAASVALLGAAQMERKDVIVFGSVLFSFPAAWVWTFLDTNPIAIVVADAQQYSLAQIVRRNPLVEFVCGNLLSLNILGGVVLLRRLRRGEWRDRAFLTASFAPLLLASLSLLLVRSAQTGASWRMTAIWSMLLLPFTAHLLARSSSGVARRWKMLAPALSALVVLAFVHDTFRIERESAWAFPPSDRQAGRYLDEVITTDRTARVLIESSGYYFLNVQVASQHPDAFVQNSVPGSRQAPILPPRGSVRATLDGQGIRYLAFTSAEYKDFLSSSPDVAKRTDFGRWSVFELTAPPR